jgi:hypothetical protein
MYDMLMLLKELRQRLQRHESVAGRRYRCNRSA